MIGNEPLRNHYMTLQIPNFSSIDDIKEAFKKLAKIYHPDINKDPRAGKWFITIKKAYDFFMVGGNKEYLDARLRSSAQRPVNVRNNASRRKKYSTNSSIFTTTSSYGNSSLSPDEFDKLWKLFMDGVAEEL